MSQSLATYAKKNCANWRDNFCWQTHETAQQNNLKIRPGECAVSQGYVCRYFRRCIYPLAPADLQTKYEFIDPQAKDQEKAQARRCPDCGSVIKARIRYCPECRKKRRRATYRESQRRNRLNCAALSTVNGF